MGRRCFLRCVAAQAGSLLPAAPVAVPCASLRPRLRGSVCENAPAQSGVAELRTGTDPGQSQPYPGPCDGPQDAALLRAAPSASQEYEQRECRLAGSTWHPLRPSLPLAITPAPSAPSAPAPSSSPLFSLLPPLALNPSSRRGAPTACRPVLPTLGPACSSLLMPGFSFTTAVSPSKVVPVVSPAQYDSLIKDSHPDQLIVVDFTAIWCRPCQMIAPVLDELSLSLPNVSIVKVDIDNDELQSLVEAAKVSAVPTFHFFKGGKLLSTFSGADKQKLKDTIAVLSNA